MEGVNRLKPRFRLNEASAFDLMIGRQRHVFPLYLNRKSLALDGKFCKCKCASYQFMGKKVLSTNVIFCVDGR